MPLNDYEFQLNNAGVLLNEDTTAYPFVDIERVAGLDSAPFRETARDHEGTDGGFFDAEFERGRDVILDGIIYCDTSTKEDFLDDLKANYAPSTVPIPFYFKAPGVDERVLFVKPRGVRFDWELARRIGITNAQFMMYAEDPRIYDNELQSLSIPFGGAAGTGFGFDPSYDFFDDRTTTSTWEDLPTGETWTNAGGAAADHIVNSGKGKHVHQAAGTAFLETFGAFTAFDITAVFTYPVTATGNSYEHNILARFVDNNNFYQASLVAETSGNLTLEIWRDVATTFTNLGSFSAGAYSPGTIKVVRFYGYGTTLQAKVWTFGAVQPATWDIAVTDASHTTGAIGVKSQFSAGNTNTFPITLEIDDFQRAGGLDFDFGFGADVPPTGGTVVVGGNRPAPAVLTLSGVMVNPIIFNVTDSKNLVFTDLTLGASDSLVIDLLDRTVILNGSINRRANLTTAEWFLFNPGNTFIVLGGGSGTGSLLIEYRNAWR